MQRISNFTVFTHHFLYPRADMDRSFSRLERIKNKLHNTMAKKKKKNVKGLTLLNELRDVKVTAGEVLEVLLQKKKKDSSGFIR